MKSITIKQSITNRDRDSVNLYLKDISHVKMLSADEEKEVARKAKEGDKKARDRLIAANTRFVVSVAKQYQGQGLDLEDLIAEGNAGLIHAADKFDPDLGWKFISYAVWWIRQSILQALSNKSRTIRLPLNQVALLNKVRKATSDFICNNERSPSLEELSDLTGIDESKILTIINMSTKMTSLDAPLSDEEDGTYVDVIANKNIPKTDESLMRESKNADIAKALSDLGPRGHDIIRMYFGLGCREQTLEEIGEKFGVTSERIRQLKEKALNIIKPKVKKYLK
jgi:RNA polymerase primary sigma factor